MSLKQDKVRFVLNPENHVESYIACADQSFNTWGGERMYDWVFRRKIGSLSADRFVILDENELVGGSALTYRALKTKRGVLLAAIITGSFTKLNYRRKGFFSEIVSRTFERARSQGAHIYVGFAAQRNASVMRLIEMGCETMPSWYCAFDLTKEPKQESIDVEITKTISLPDLQWAFCTRRGRLNEKSHFEYTFDEWRGQMIARSEPSALFLVKSPVGAIGYFILSDLKENLRLVEFFGTDPFLDEKIFWSAMKESRRSGTKMDAFTTEEKISEIFKGAKGNVVPGFFFLKACDRQALAEYFSTYEQTCETMETKALSRTLLGFEDQKFSLQPFVFHSGDRM